MANKPLILTSATVNKTDGTEAISVDASGNVGIAEPAPSQRLTVNGGLYVESSATLPTNAPGGFLASYEYPATRVYFGDGTGYRLTFSKRQSSTTADLLTIHDNGKVQNTAGLPQVSSGSNALTGAFDVVETTLNDGYYGTALHWQSLIPGGYRQHASIGSWRSGAWGTVFIGVGGSDSNLTAFYNFAYTGAAFQGNNSSTWSTTSDIRVKQNIRPINSCLEKITTLNPVHFEYIHKPEQIKTGFIAQEFEQVLPGHVSESACPSEISEIKPELKDEKIKAIDADLIPYLVGAIKEQQALIQELRAEGAALRAEVEALRNQS